MLREAKNTTTCLSCTATQLVTTYYCVVCRRGLCSSCAGAGSRNSCPLVQCALCRRQDALSALRPTDDPAQRRHREVLLNATLEGLVRLEQALLSEATYTRHASNLRTWETYCEESGFAPYPATQTSISLFVPWALMVKNLNPCTVDLILGALSGWHQQAQAALAHATFGPITLTNYSKSVETRALIKTVINKYALPKRVKMQMSVEVLAAVIFRGFDTATRYGRQHQAFALVCMACPARPSAAASLTCCYDIIRSDGSSFVRTHPSSDVHFHHHGDSEWDSRYIHINMKWDKNVVLSEPRDIYIPPVVAGMPVFDLLHNYILSAKPPSGGYMLVAPTSPNGTGFHSTPFTNFNDNFQKAARRAMPEWDPADKRWKHYGGGTPRKSMAQWLNVNGTATRQLANICGWALPDSGQAIDGYLHTTPRMQMDAKASLPAPAYY